MHILGKSIQVTLVTTTGDIIYNPLPCSSSSQSRLPKGKAQCSLLITPHIEVILLAFLYKFFYRKNIFFTLVSPFLQFFEISCN